jgi:hypothetical protein
MTRRDHTSGWARGRTTAAEGELAAPDGESLAYGGKLQTSGRFPLNRGLSVTDGPFAETKEGLGGGSALVDAGNQDTVIEVPLAWLGTIEVRRMMAIGAHWGRRSGRQRVRVYQTTCEFCGLPLAARGSVLFQGAHLVHATCWRTDPKPFHDTPDATLMEVPGVAARSGHRS